MSQLDDALEMQQCISNASSSFEWKAAQKPVMFYLLPHHYTLSKLLTSCFVYCLRLNLYLWSATTQPPVSAKQLSHGFCKNKSN